MLQVQDKVRINRVPVQGQESPYELPVQIKVRKDKKK